MAGTFVRDFWRRSREIDIKTFPCEGEEFDVMALTSDQFKQIQDCATSKAMLELASNIGQMCDRERISDNPSMSQDFERLWRDLDAELEYDDSPSLREQVGRYVCDISGLAGVVDAKIADEEEQAELEAMEAEENVLNADGVSQEQLAKEAEEFQQQINAA